MNSDNGHPLRDGLSSLRDGADTVSTFQASIPDAVRVLNYDECLMTGDTIVRLSDGRSVRFRRHEAEQGSIQAWLAMMAVASSAGRVDVIQYGRKVGELPSFWTPMLAKSKSFLYIYRQGDLTLRDGKWHASPALGAGDLDCLVGFVRKEDAAKAMEARQGQDPMGLDAKHDSAGRQALPETQEDQAND
jgi:hypothetical protein